MLMRVLRVMVNDTVDRIVPSHPPNSAPPRRPPFSNIVPAKPAHQSRRQPLFHTTQSLPSRAIQRILARPTLQHNQSSCGR